VHQEIVRVAYGPAVPPDGPHDHPVLVQDAGVPSLALVGVAERGIGRLDEGRVRADRQQPESARKGSIG